jgi:hypothetical protein
MQAIRRLQDYRRSGTRIAGYQSHQARSWFSFWIAENGKKQ